jgi:hypothetical protein
MEWVLNNWIALALVFIVLVALAAFGVGGRGEQAPRAGGCCGGMERDKETS